MNGKVCLVTGATSGIGFEVSKGLARDGATVAMVGRDERRGRDAVTRVKQATASDRVELLLADLASLAEVRELAEAFTARHDQLHVLVNNAGLVLNTRKVTVDGFEHTFAVNHLAPFLLTALLSDLLQASALARIVNVSSEAHRGGRIDFDDLQSERSYSGFPVYSMTKLCNVLFANELARRLDGTGVTANSLHPGFVASRFGRNNRGLFGVGMAIVQRIGAISPQKGAETPLYVATSPDLDGVSGRYFDKCAERIPSAAARDRATAERLWEVSERLTGLRMD